MMIGWVWRSLIALVLLAGPAAAANLGQVPWGAATLWPPQGTTAFGPPSKIWPTTLPDGTKLNCSGTASNCAQELLDAMVTKGSTDIYGGGGSVGSNAVTAFTGTLNVPVLREAYVHLHGGGLFQTGNPTPGTPAVTIDSMVEGSFVVEGGQIASATATSAGGGTQSGSAPVVLLDPHTVLPIEGFIGIGASHLELGNVAVQWNSGQSDSCVEASLLHGGITRSYIGATEINGGGPSPTTTGCKYGYLIARQPGGGSPNAYVQNLHVLPFVHLFSDAGIQEGLTADDAAAIIQNVYLAGGIGPRGAASGCVSSGARGGLFLIGGCDNSEGTVQYGLATASSASDIYANLGVWATSSAITAAVNWTTASNSYAYIRQVTTSGGSITKLCQDGGSNNLCQRGATLYGASGLTFVTVDAGGNQTGGSILTGTGLTIPSMQTTTAGAGKKALCMDGGTGAFFVSTTASC